MPKDVGFSISIYWGKFRHINMPKEVDFRLFIRINRGIVLQLIFSI